MNRPGTSNGETDGKSRSGPKKSLAEGGGYRRPIAAILIISFIVMATVGAFALAEPDDYPEASGDTNDSGACGAGINWNRTGTELAITGHGKMYSYEGKTLPWGTAITSVKFFDDSIGSIEDIGCEAFKGCTVLRSVDLSDTKSISTIGMSAFYGCTDLTSVNLGTHVTTIGEYAFCECETLTSIVIPDTVTKIDANAFNGCTELREVTFGTRTNDMTIENGAFTDCTALTSIDLSTATSIGNIAFIRCTSLGTVTFGNKLTSIGNSAFELCGLTTITIPNSVTSIGKEAFASCVSLGSLTIYGGGKGVAIGESAFSGCTSLDKVTLQGDHVTSIGDKAFMNCGTLGEIYISSKVTSIGQYAFAYSKLAEIKIPSKVSSIGQYAFYQCANLTSVTIEEGTDEESTVALTIGEKAFAESGLTSVTIPGRVSSIGDCAFLDCAELTAIDVDGGNQNYSSEGGVLFNKDNNGNKTVLIQCPAKISLENGTYAIPDKVETIEHYAFKNCTSLTSVDISDSVTSIGDEAFINCTKLTSVTFGTKIATVGSNVFGTKNETTSTPSYTDTLFDTLKSEGIAFSQDKVGEFQGWMFTGSITEMNIVKKVTDNGVFYEIVEDGGSYSVHVTGYDSSSTLGDVEISSTKTFGHKELNVTAINNSAFSGCVTLTSITIPATVTIIGDNAFAGSGLTTITIPSSVTKIGDCAFVDCQSLTAISVDEGNQNYYSDGGVLFDIGMTTLIQCPAGIDLEESGTYEIPATVTTIGQYAFSKCKLTSIDIPDTVTEIKDMAFVNCTNLKAITFGTGIATVGDHIFGTKTGEDYEDTTFDALGAPDINFTTENLNKFNGWMFTYNDDTAHMVVVDATTIDGVTYKIFQNEGGSDYSAHVIGSDTGISGEKTICNEITLGHYTFPVTAIDDSAFSGRASLTKVTIPSSVTSIGESAFSGCTDLSSITIPDSVKTIGEKAFGGCDGLTSVTFGDSAGSSLTSIAEDAFCDSKEVLTKFFDGYGNKITLAEIISNYKGKTFTGNISEMYYSEPGVFPWEGVIYKYDASTGIAYVSGFNDSIGKETTILDSFSVGGKTYRVTSIAKDAFKDCTTLTSVTIPDSVETIGESAFEGCKNMASVKLPDGITEINDRVFYGCKALTSITIPDSVETIGEKAFGGCDGLETIVFGNGITEIAENAFCDSNGKSTKFNDELKKQIYPSSDIAKFRGQTFTGSISEMNLENLGVIICDGVIYVVSASGEAYVYGCTDKINSETKILDSVTIDGVPYKVTSIGAGAFEDCTKLTSITIPDSVKDIKEYAFLNCTNLETVSFGTGIETVDPTAFSTGKKGGAIVPTVFYDENHDPIDLSAQAEKLRGEMFKGDIYEMTITRTITIDDGTSTQTYTGRVGDKIPRPADPTRDGYKFLYWADEDGNEFDWTIPAKDIKITAVWKAVSPSGDDDDNPPYNPSGKDSESTNGSDRDSVNFLIIVACIAAFMAVLAAYVCSGKR